MIDWLYARMNKSEWLDDDEMTHLLWNEWSVAAETNERYDEARVLGCVVAVVDVDKQSCGDVLSLLCVLICFFLTNCFAKPIVFCKKQTTYKWNVRVETHLHIFPVEFDASSANPQRIESILKINLATKVLIWMAPSLKQKVVLLGHD